MLLLVWEGEVAVLFVSVSVLGFEMILILVKHAVPTQNSPLK